MRIKLKVKYKTHVKRPTKSYMVQDVTENINFETGHPVVYYQICVIYYVPSIHNIQQDKMQQLQLGYIWLHVSA